MHLAPGPRVHIIAQALLKFSDGPTQGRLDQARPGLTRWQQGGIAANHSGHSARRKLYRVRRGTPADAGGGECILSKAAQGMLQYICEPVGLGRAIQRRGHRGAVHTAIPGQQQLASRCHLRVRWLHLCQYL
mgnify:CR=1 FL=1